VSSPLGADARSVLSSWTAPDAAQAGLQHDFLAHLGAHEDGMWRECLPDHITGSALIVRDDDVLLVMHGKAGKWLQMGGHCEPGDATLADIALREAREESGISTLTIDPVPLRLSRHRVPFCGGGNHLDVQFLAIAPPDAEPSLPDGHDPVSWFRSAPEPTDQDVHDLIAAARLRLQGSP
jgi:8-oxo-dGTP pyrophosphatase MutT (NUDIX family)